MLEAAGYISRTFQYSRDLVAISLPNGDSNNGPPKLRQTHTICVHPQDELGKLLMHAAATPARPSLQKHVAMTEHKNDENVSTDESGNNSATSSRAA